MSRTTNPLIQPAARTVVETATATEPPVWTQAEWTAAFPWLVHGITGRFRDAAYAAYDMSLFGASPTSAVQSRWSALQRLAGMPYAILARQVHGSAVLSHTHAGEGLLITGPADGHTTDHPGVLLTVSVADCVPISIVDGQRHAVALLHGGWRGIAAGIFERGIATLSETVGSRALDLHVHFGPSICGECYEVGPDVHQALGARVQTARPIDLRSILAVRAAALGVRPERITVSAHCTRCGSGFHSHRAGARERQIAFLGIRPDAGG